MSEDLKQMLDGDIFEFFKQIENQNDIDRVNTLRLLMDKYLHITKSEHLMNMYDLRTITSKAAGKASNNAMGRSLESGVREVKLTTDESIRAFLIEATIEHLNKTGCLKKKAKFNYK